MMPKLIYSNFLDNNSDEHDTYMDFLHSCSDKQNTYQDFLNNNDDKHNTYLDFVGTLHQNMDLMTRSTCDYYFSVVI
jgi:hypothetical protein